MELELKHRLVQPGLGRLAEKAVVGLIILVVLVLFSPANTPVLPRDEGVFVYIGQGILQGRLPYRDLWDHKGPLIYYIDALGLWIGQHSLWGIWLVEAAALAFSLFLLYRLLRRVLGVEAAMLGLLVWLAGFAIVLGGNIVEEFAIPLTVLALCLGMRRVREDGLWLGLLGGLGFMLRPNEIAGPVVVLLFVLVDALRAGDRKAALAQALQFAGGFLLIAGGFAAYFAANRALGDFVSSVFLFNLYYVSKSSSPFPSLLAGAAYLAGPVLFALGGTFAALVPGRTTLSRDQRRLLFMAAALFGAVVPLSLLSGRVYRHYYIPWLLPLSILGSFCVLWFGHAPARARLSKITRMLCWALLWLAVVVSVRIRIVPLLAGGAPPAEAQTVAGLRSLAPLDSELFIWGDETSYAVMAGRTLAGRYLYTSPLLMPGYGETIAPRVLADLSASRPLIIDTSGSLDAVAPYPYLSPLFAFVHQEYRRVGTLPGRGWTVWGPK